MRPLAWGEWARDVADAEVAQDPAELGGVLGALQLFLHAPVGVVADEDAEAIAVEGHRQPVARGEPPEQGEIAVQILGGPEVQGQDGARRIVDGAEQAVQRRPRAEPVELTAVDEDEAAQGRVARAAGAVLARPAPALGRQASRPPQPADGAAADRQALDAPGASRWRGSH